MAGRLSDFTSLHEHTERLARARGLDATVDALLASGTALLGANRALLVTAAPGGGPGRPIGHGLDRASLGSLETVPADQSPVARLLRERDRPDQLECRDLAHDPAVGARLRELAASSASAAATACRSPPRRTARWPPRSGSTTSPPVPPSASASWPTATARSPPRCWPSSWTRRRSAAPPRRCAAACCPTGSPADRPAARRPAGPGRPGPLRRQRLVRRHPAAGRHRRPHRRQRLR
ncbi:hypothetical protein ACFQ0M_24295 [Kitasatospora aburaviensis]